MKNSLILKLKDIFMYITLFWSGAMTVIYLVVLSEIPLFSFISYLPLGDFICRILEFLMLFGIWAVPVLWVITVIFMILARKTQAKNKRIAVLTAIVPAILAAIMLLTDFNDVLG